MMYSEAVEYVRKTGNTAVYDLGLQSRVNNSKLVWDAKGARVLLVIGLLSKEETRIRGIVQDIIIPAPPANELWYLVNNNPVHFGPWEAEK